MGLDMRAVIIYATSVLGMSLALMEILALALGVAQVESLFQFKIDSVLDELTIFMTMKIENAAGFFAALAAFGISGAVAGVRVKHALGGALAAFLGSAGGIAVTIGTLIMFYGKTISAEVGFYIGLVVIIIACTIAGYLAGKASIPPSKEKVRRKDRRIWTKTYEEEVWKCNDCGEQIPRGAFSCPNCGAGVME